MWLLLLSAAGGVVVLLLCCDGVGVLSRPSLQDPPASRQPPSLFENWLTNLSPPHLVLPPADAGVRGRRAESGGHEKGGDQRGLRGALHHAVRRRRIVSRRRTRARARFAVLAGVGGGLAGGLCVARVCRVVVRFFICLEWTTRAPIGAILQAEQNSCALSFPRIVLFPRPCVPPRPFPLFSPALGPQLGAKRR